MNEQILVAIFSLAGSLIGVAGGILTANKLVNHRIENLERRLGNVPERVSVMELKQDEDRARNMGMSSKLDQIHNDVIIFKHELNKKAGGS